MTGPYLDTRARIAQLWRRGQLGWPRRYPLLQFPNPPLVVALLGSVLAAVGFLAAAGLWRVLSVAGLIVWAGEEVYAGANLFRRLLGVAVLVWLVLGLLDVR